MSEYSEVVNLTRLANNHTNVDLQFILSDEVVVDCVIGGICSNNVNSLPLPIYALLSDSQVFLQHHVAELVPWLCFHSFYYR